MEIVAAVVLDSDWKITHLTLKYVFRCVLHVDFFFNKT